jgi:hypothetical protein
LSHKFIARRFATKIIPKYGRGELKKKEYEKLGKKQTR